MIRTTDKNNNMIIPKIEFNIPDAVFQQSENSINRMSNITLEGAIINSM